MGSWCTHSVLYRSPGQRNNRIRSPWPWWSNGRASWKASLEGKVLNQTSWTNSSEFCFNLASIVKIRTHAWLAARVLNFHVELTNGSLTPSCRWGPFWTPWWLGGPEVRCVDSCVVLSYHYYHFHYLVTQRLITLIVKEYILKILIFPQLVIEIPRKV